MKRTLWAGIGYTVGLGSSFYLQKRVRRSVDRFAPPQVRHDVAIKGRQVADRAREVVIDLREAAQEGVDAMRNERSSLLAEFSVEDELHAGPARGLDPSERRRGGFRPLD